MQPHGPFDSAYLSGLRPSSHVLSKQRGARLSPRQSCSPFCLCPGASPNACVSVRCGFTQRLWNPLGMPWEHSDPHKSAAVICDGCGFVTKQKYWGPKLAKAGSVHWHEGLHGKPYCPMCCVEHALRRGADTPTPRPPTAPGHQQGSVLVVRHGADGVRREEWSRGRSPCALVGAAVRQHHW